MFLTFVLQFPFLQSTFNNATLGILTHDLTDQKNKIFKQNLRGQAFSSSPLTLGVSKVSIRDGRRGTGVKQLIVCVDLK